MTAGFFETHRPYPRDRYQPANAATVEMPGYLPDTAPVRQDLADFYGAIATKLLAEVGGREGATLAYADASLFMAIVGIITLCLVPIIPPTPPAIKK